MVSRLLENCTEWEFVVVVYCISYRCLWSVLRKKWMYLAMGVFALILMVSNRATEGWSWRLSAAIYFPYVIVSLWHLFGAFGEFAWSLDAEINEGARKILRNDVTAIMLLIILVGLARQYIPDGDFKEAEKQVRSGLLGLFLVYTWLGIVRALLAVWEKVGGDADAESRVGASQAHGCASVTCEPALTNGSDGGGSAAAAASQDGGQSGEARTSVAEQVDDKNGRGWLMLATGVAIGVLANGVVVRRLHRN